MLPAVALSYETAESDIMKRKPRDPLNDRLVNARLISFAYIQLGVIQSLCGFLMFTVVIGNCGFYVASLFGMANLWTTQDKIILFQGYFPFVVPYLFKPKFLSFSLDSTGKYVERDYTYRRDALHYANGACFLAVVMNQWTTLISCKTRKRSVFQQGMKNKYVNIGIIEETLLVILILYVPPLNFVFGTKQTSWKYWFIPVPFALFMLTYDETRKWLMRKKNSRIAQWLEDFTYY